MDSELVAHSILVSNKTEMKKTIAIHEFNSIDLKEVFQSQKSYVTNLAMRQLSLSRADALGLFTDAILILKENVEKGKLNHSKYLRAYVYRIMKNLWLQDQKIVKRQTLICSEIQNLSTNNTSDLDSEATLKLDTVLAELNTRHRKVLELYYVHKLSLREIAEDLGYKSDAVVKNIKFRALQHCREQFLIPTI